MREAFLPFSPPSIGEEEIAEVVDTLRSGWITTGPRVRQFETGFQRALGAPAALALNSCTGALHVALAALGVGAGDEVITTTMTFAATVNVIEHLGARPVLVDVEPDTLNIDPGAVDAAVRASGGRVRVIIPVHLYGHPCDMGALLETARTHRLRVVEDAAHALPAKYEGRTVGTIGDLTAFSFYATKNMTTGEGGMLTGAPRLLDRAALWALHGMDRDAWKRYSAAGSWLYEVVAPGFKYNMTDIQAALGLHQLRRLPEFHRRRRAIALQYTRSFSEIEALEPPVERAGVQHAWHIYALRLNLAALTIDRARFITALQERNIGSSVHFIPIHLHPYYRDRYGYLPEAFPIAWREYQRLVSLPIYPAMTDSDVADVIEAVAAIVRSHSR